MIFDAKTNIAKITDFGESLMINKEQDFENPVMIYKTGIISIGTAGYKAPEMIKIDCKHWYNYKVDVFSFGSLCFELITTEFVSGKKELKNYQSLKEHEHITLIPDDCPDKFGQLIYECWQFNANKRPTFDKIIQDLESMIKQK